MQKEIYFNDQQIEQGHSASCVTPIIRSKKQKCGLPPITKNTSVEHSEDEKNEKTIPLSDEARKEKAHDKEAINEDKPKKIEKKEDSPQKKEEKPKQGKEDDYGEDFEQ